jgi:intein/homing endonuclease
MKLDLSKVEFSRKDRIKGITIPNALDENLAELIGFHIGDGHLRFVPPEYKITFSGHKHKDKQYYEQHLNPMLRKLFGVPFSFTESKKSNEFRLYMDSKAIATLWRNVFGLPQRKDNVRIPEAIRNSSDKIKIAFIRGFMEADGTFYTKNRKPPYPVIEAASSSKILINDFSVLLKELGFQPCSVFDMESFDKRSGKRYTSHAFYLNGRKNFDLWMSKIGFKNEKHLKKIREFI